MQTVSAFKTHKLSDYEPFASQVLFGELQANADKLRTKKIYEINSTANGGGVAELLSSQLPFYKSLGLDVKWLALPPNDNFFAITKNLHNCLQGRCELPSEPDLRAYQKYLHDISLTIPLDGDVYVLHDPQTLGLAPFLLGKKLIWRCHIDLTQAEADVLDWVKTYYQYFDKIIFSLQAYVSGLPANKVTIINPSIDPLSDKNAPLPHSTIDGSLQKFGLVDKQYLLQVSRFDKYKNPLGVLEIFTAAKKLLPNLQCVLAGSYATDDPEGKPYFEKVTAAANKLDAQNVKIITTAKDSDINALQSSAAAVIQNSTQEGFGLTVTEALWKEKFVFSRPVGGIALQVIANKTGFYLDSNNYESAQLIAQVLNNPQEYKAIGAQAKDHVFRKFLLPKMVLDYLQVYNLVLEN